MHKVLHEEADDKMPDFHDRHFCDGFSVREITEGGSDMFNQDYSPRLKFQRKIARISLR